MSRLTFICTHQFKMAKKGLLTNPFRGLCFSAKGAMPNALSALSDARSAVRARSDADAPVIMLAQSLGASRPRPSTLRAIHAVLDKLEHPGAYARDQDAWEAHGASSSSYLKWKNSIHGLLLSAAADVISDDDLVEFTAVHSALHSIPAEPTSCMSAPGLDADAALAVELANQNSQALLRDHAHAFVTRNGGEATFEGWIAQLHPENVKIDHRLRIEGCPHQQIWTEAIRNAPAMMRRPGLVEVGVGAAFAVAIVSIDVALWMCDLMLTPLGESAADGRRALCELLSPSTPGTVVLLPAVLICAALEASFKASSAILRTVGSATVGGTTVFGGSVLGLLALSPRAGQHAAARLQAAAPRLRRRLQHLVAQLRTEAAAARVAVEQLRTGKTTARKLWASNVHRARGGATPTPTGTRVTVGMPPTVPLVVVAVPIDEAPEKV